MFVKFPEELLHLTQLDISLKWRHSEKKKKKTRWTQNLFFLFLFTHCEWFTTEISGSQCSVRASSAEIDTAVKTWWQLFYLTAIIYLLIHTCQFATKSEERRFCFISFYVNWFGYFSFKDILNHITRHVKHFDGSGQL